MEIRRPNAQDDVDVWVGLTEDEAEDLYGWDYVLDMLEERLSDFFGWE